MKIRKEPNYSLSLSQQNSKFFLVPVLTVVEDIRVAPSQWAERERQHKRKELKASTHDWPANIWRKRISGNNRRTQDLLDNIILPDECEEE